MNVLFLRLVVVCALCWLALPATAGVIEKGQPIEEVEKAMTKAGYEATQLAVMPVAGEDFRFWSVDEVDNGVMIVHFDSRTRKVTKMVYWLTDGRPKSTRKVFELPVASFDPESGLMTLRTRKPKGEAPAKKG
ncbi:hypothetical protein OKA05_00655 [Luteolibacter arcticus]|uniref:Uncharacterized protein n=1 Tax=Luteolibacter arcticus TaxID=1581411 RepID=A0ABT3GBN8_9BACT|nr:hypothetical protein [Luteolibacter arcticus]MCW1921042.1 hypothetical protein [Luteolibacter arcticus]